MSDLATEILVRGRRLRELRMRLMQLIGLCQPLDLGAPDLWDDIATETAVGLENEPEKLIEDLDGRAMKLDFESAKCEQRIKRLLEGLGLAETTMMN